MAENLEKTVGEYTASLLESIGLDTVDSVRSASDEEILGVEGIGPATLRDIRRNTKLPEDRVDLKLPQLPRRFVRYILFRIKRDAVETMDRDRRIHVSAIKAHFEIELRKKGKNWTGFTFDWDLAPNDPYRIIEKDLRTWVAAGGSFIGRPPGMSKEAWAKHVVGSLLQNHETTPFPMDPPAFTRQA